jgi:hypothetical protein
MVNTLTGPKEAFSLCRKFGGFVVRNPKSKTTLLGVLPLTLKKFPV